MERSSAGDNAAAHPTLCLPLNVAVISGQKAQRSCPKTVNVNSGSQFGDNQNKNNNKQMTSLLWFFPPDLQTPGHSYTSAQKRLITNLPDFQPEDQKGAPQNWKL